MRWYKLLLGTLLFASYQSGAANLNLPTAPLFVNGQSTPLVMLVMGRDHTLYYAAYNDTTDLDGDGVPDTHYNPAVNYYGLFDSFKCYTYDTKNTLFKPSSTTSTKKCSNAWSGDFLNYLTTSRIDALRRVLYGGQRLNDSTNTAGTIPVLTRSYIPKDSHSWGKTWDPAIMKPLGLSLSDYTPLAEPNTGTQCFFASTTLYFSPDQPLLRVVNNVPGRFRIWNWVSRESTADSTYGGNKGKAAGQPTGGIAGNFMDDPSPPDSKSTELQITPTDYVVNVQVCVPGLLESNCEKYANGNYKPTGLLHKFGEGDNPKMEFGLITGSYNNNLSGGVLRAKIAKLANEINSTTGQLTTRPNSSIGIFDTLNRLKIMDYNGSSYSCGWITGGPITNGQCRDWGNPIAEMLFESLRYFAGAKAPTTAFSTTSDANGLQQDGWDDPFAATGRHWCDRPINLVISDVNPSYDSDQIPGTVFVSGSVPTDPALAGFNAATSTKAISTSEGLNGGYFYIGENLNSSGKNIPTPKTITDLSTIRGLSPQEPTKLGSFYSAGAAYYGWTHDVNANMTGDQKVKTLVVALSSHLPEIKLRVGSGVITLIPYAKSVGGNSINAGSSAFQPTDGIVAYYIDDGSTAQSGGFRINFDDVEQGGDQDMDMIVHYQYQVTNNQLKITMTTEYAAGGITQHAGYVISGTTADGLYLDVQDKLDSNEKAVNYYLDTVASPDSPYPNNARTTNATYKNVNLPTTQNRTFTVNPQANAAAILPSPLWFAAKWGSFNDKNNNGIPDEGEWDSLVSGVPDNYFLVTNASNLESQLNAALDSASKDDRSASSMSYTSSQVSATSLYFDATFEAKYWSGDVKAYPFVNNAISANANWDAEIQLEQQLATNGVSGRKIFTLDTDGSKRQFAAPTALTGSATGLSASQITALQTGFDQSQSNQVKLAYVQALVNYLSGDRSYEKSQVPPGLSQNFRQRNGVLGDIVHSTPVYGVSAGDQQPFLIFGANDGMVHVLNASTGNELFAYMPSSSYANLYRLAGTDYNDNINAHRYFVDGNIRVATLTTATGKKTIAVGSFGLGGKGIWALDLTNIKTPTASQNLLWEYTDQTGGDYSTYLGYITHAPAVIQDRDGNWIGLVGNGYNSVRGEGGLLVFSLLDGSVKRWMATGYGIGQDPSGSSRPNSVTEPVVADLDGDGRGDFIYAGDLFGNVWRADIRTDAVADWSFDQAGANHTITPMFKAVSPEGKAQPITNRPSVGLHPVMGVLVLVGTGKYLETGDVDTSSQMTQSVYGLWDYPGRAAAISGRSQLVQQTITNEVDTSPTSRTLSHNSIAWTGDAAKQGWYLDLTYNGSNHGERVNSTIKIINTTAAFTTLIPSSDPCTGGGTGWYMEMGLYSGSNSAPDQNLVSHSALLSGIPSSPEMLMTTSNTGDKNLSTTVKVDGQQPFISPATVYKTGTVSWQRLY